MDVWFLPEKQHELMNIWIYSFPQLDGLANIIFKQDVIYSDFGNVVRQSLNAKFLGK
jgi:hypothetical protein